MTLMSRYRNSLFLFNDNFQQRNSFVKGNGNASIRPLKKNKLSFGIPTGWSVNKGGFAILDDQVKKCIDIAFEKIALIHSEKCYDAMYFSATSNGQLGYGTFSLCSEVIMYITDKLKSIYNITHRSMSEIEKDEEQLESIFTDHYTFPYNSISQLCSSQNTTSYTQNRPSLFRKSPSISKKPIFKNLPKKKGAFKHL